MAVASVTLVAAERKPDDSRRKRRGRPLGARRKLTSPAPLRLKSTGEPDLLSTLAHELRSPLAALMTSSQLVIEDFDTLDREQVLGMVMTMHRGTLWLQGLVENLLCAASIQEDHLTVHPRPVDLARCVAEAGSVIGPLLRQRRQDLRVTVRGGLPLALADERRIEQVLMNLILNASKFSPANRPIDVSLIVRRPEVRVVVADRGPGLPPDCITSLFEPFYRGHHPGQVDTGMGLGLAIVRSIVEAHGGGVGAENRRGGGARFWFTLPGSVGQALPLSDWARLDEVEP